ncbi:short-chain dehydrogenase [Ophiobolus disseminans]|uniref:Short-chain dehydrogenase n=1 Tax=Ophiobolus disseminans TaxID=1469910 RepID=A0A6A6ZV87_9PLEO|nr:short-chain dehydrogenase [Ophiobolus disseminans]
MSRYAEAHKLANVTGPGDARPTALQVIKDEGLLGKLSDKVFLVTGVSSGIGLETVRALHTTGAHVFGTVRDMPKGQQVINQILDEEHPGGGKINLINMSLDNFASICAGAQEFLTKSKGKLNAIIANAGIMATPFGKTTDGFEQQFATNHLSHFLLFHLLKSALLASATPEYPSRYVSISSLAHMFNPVHLGDYNYDNTPYSPWDAYSQSKTANIWFANAIERRYGSQHLHATSVHPGGIATSGLAKHLTADDPIVATMTPDTFRTYKSAEQGAATQVYAAVSEEWKHKGGRYLASMVEQKSRVETRKVEGMYEHANEGWAEWVYDVEGEERLWVDSLGIVGLKDGE